MNYKPLGSCILCIINIQWSWVILLPITWQTLCHTKKYTCSGILFCYQYILIYALHYHVYKHVLSLLIKTLSSWIVRNVLQLLFTLSYLYLPLLTFAYLCSSLPPSYGTVTDGALPYSSVTNNNREGTEDGDSFITTDDKTVDDDAELYDNHPKVGHSS